MSHKVKSVLDLDYKDAQDFFLKSEQYHGFEMPEYFVFDELLRNVKEAIADVPYGECLNGTVKPDELPNVNLDILLNKDGKYAVRPIVLANPFLYYFFVREICNQRAWSVIKDLFEKFHVPHISSCALPVVPEGKESFHKSATIIHWWNAMEQRSIELSLEYRYMFVTDITNCYGSVDPQTFDKAFSLKGTRYEISGSSPIATNIQRYLCAFQHGRNIGLPQGSAVFDFVGEIILGYSDLLLHEAIGNAGIEIPYEIIRYRDDYRIFCNDKTVLEQISYILQHVLEGLNFRMNSKKTYISESIVTDSIKPDKLAYIYNTPIYNKKGVDFDSFEKHLLYILMFARKYPDSGSVRTMLADLDKRVEKRLSHCKNGKSNEKWEDVDLDGNGKTETQKECNVFSKLKTYQTSQSLSGGSVRALAAICVQIALENVASAHYALQVLSRMVDSLSDEEEKSEIIGHVYTRLCNQPNSDYNQLWLQNITYQRDKQEGRSPYDMRLCRVVAGDKDVELWNNQWLKPELLKAVSLLDIVDTDKLNELTPVITFRERRAYDETIGYADDAESDGIDYYHLTDEEIDNSEIIATF